MKKTIHSVFAGLICCFFITFALSSTIFAAEKAASKKPKATKAQTSKKPTTKMVADEKVLAAQKALNQSGFKLKEDGLMGPKTSGALKQYQKKNGLKVTGKLDKATLAKLGID